jgi:hypothetical protein
MRWFYSFKIILISSWCLRLGPPSCHFTLGYGTVFLSVLRLVDHRFLSDINEHQKSKYINVVIWKSCVLESVVHIFTLVCHYPHSSLEAVLLT